MWLKSGESAGGRSSGVRANQDEAKEALSPHAFIAVRTLLAKISAGRANDRLATKSASNRRLYDAPTVALASHHAVEKARRKLPTTGIRNFGC